MSDSLAIPGAARVAAGAFVAGAGLVGGLWAWTSRTPMPPPPDPQPVVLWPGEPEQPADPVAAIRPVPADTTVPDDPEDTEPGVPVAVPLGPTLVPIEPAPKTQPETIVDEPLPSMPIDAGPEPEPEVKPQPAPEAADPAPETAAVQRIDINAAGNAELQLLPGIGPVLAQRIVDDRAANGRFGSLNDLQRVKGIGEKTAAKLAPLITFG